jgi:hypothetical protein
MSWVRAGSPNDRVRTMIEGVRPPRAPPFVGGDGPHPDGLPFSSSALKRHSADETKGVRPRASSAHLPNAAGIPSR